MKSSSRAQLKTSIWRTVLGPLGIAIAALSVGCSKSDGEAGTQVYQIPWPTASGEYKIQNVTIDSFENPEEMRGSYAKILVDPYVANGQLQSSQPVARFAKSGGILVPADFASLQATAIYAHIERFFKIDQKVGVAGQIKWPMLIALQANVTDQKSGSVVNNALYDGRLDALLIVPYRESKLPISLNAGILAHEHFHKIFQSIVLSRIQVKDVDVNRPVPAARASDSLENDHVHDHSEGHCDWSNLKSNLVSEKAFEGIEQKSEISSMRGEIRQHGRGHGFFDVPVKVYNQFLVRGMNEGLADFWGWVYTGDVSFIGRSLKQEENELRRMDQAVGRLPSVEVLKMSLKDPFSEDGVKKEDARYVLAYRLGTYYARFMRELALQIAGGDESNLEARLVVAKALMDALPSMAKSVTAQYTDEYISPNAILKPLYLNLPSVSQAACGLYTKFAAMDGGVEKPSKCGEETMPTSVPGKAAENVGSETPRAETPMPNIEPPKEAE